MFACVFVPQPPPGWRASGVGRGGPTSERAWRGAGDPAMVGKRRLVDLAREFSPRVEALHDWLVLLDVSGLERLVGMRAGGGPATVGFEIARGSSAASICSRGWHERN